MDNKLEIPGLVPEWAGPATVVLVWPADLYKKENNGGKITDFCEKFIRNLLQMKRRLC